VKLNVRYCRIRQFNGRALLETTPAGPPELTHRIAAMQDEFWASVRQKVAAMCEAET
jgi:hypothetical protein